MISSFIGGNSKKSAFLRRFLLRLFLLHLLLYGRTAFFTFLSAMNDIVCHSCQWSSNSTTLDCSYPIDDINDWKCWNDQDFSNCSWSSDQNTCLNCLPGESWINETSNCTEVEANSFILPLWKQMFWYVLFSAMVTVSTTGNVIVIWIVLSQKRMRTVTNYFIGKLINNYYSSLNSLLFAN